MNKYCNDKLKVYYEPKVGEIVFAKFSQGKVLCFIQASVRKIIVFCHLQCSYSIFAYKYENYLFILLVNRLNSIKSRILYNILDSNLTMEIIRMIPNVGKLEWSGNLETPLENLQLSPVGNFKKFIIVEKFKAVQIFK